VDNFVDNFSMEDPAGCHANLQEHIDGVKMCAETLRHFGISNPYQFLRSWSTNEILAALDDMIGQELEGYVIRKPAGWLWNHLSRRPDSEDETF